MTAPIYATVSTAGSAAATQPAGTASARSNQLDKDTFLKLLVAQLKYQDPSKPADSAAFMAQTAQFTMVEKPDELAKQNAELLANQQLLVAGGLLGGTITYPGPDGADTTDVVTATRLDQSGPILKVGTTEVPLSAVKEVAAATPAG